MKNAELWNFEFKILNLELNLFIFAFKLLKNEKDFIAFWCAVGVADDAFCPRHTSCPFFLSGQQGVFQYGTS
jgi:hypothetical protein